MAYEARALDEATWPAFADLVERNGGVWSGCWCMGFHEEGCKRAAEENRALKEQRVREGRAHAGLAFDGATCVGWCQFPPAELPRIKHRRAYEETGPTPPDWRITCFFVDKQHRRAGVADAALGAALGEIAQLGGGVVESSPEDTTGRKVANAFLYNATLSLFERHGFERDRRLGKHHWLVRKVVTAGRPA